MRNNGKNCKINNNFNNNCLKLCFLLLSIREDEQAAGFLISCNFATLQQQRSSGACQLQVLQEGCFASLRILFFY